MARGRPNLCLCDVCRSKSPLRAERTSFSDATDFGEKMRGRVFRVFQLNRPASNLRRNDYLARQWSVCVGLGQHAKRLKSPCCRHPMPSPFRACGECRQCELRQQHASMTPSDRSGPSTTLKPPTHGSSPAPNVYGGAQRGISLATGFFTGESTWNPPR